MKIVLILLSIVIVSISGCSTSLYVSLFNNTGETIQVVSAVSVGAVIDIPPDTSQLIRIGRGVQLIVRGIERNYPHPVVPGEYYQSHKVLWYRLNAQLEPNLNILIAKPNTKFPVSDNLEQPEGFPLVPEVAQSNKSPKPTLESHAALRGSVSGSAAWLKR